MRMEEAKRSENTAREVVTYLMHGEVKDKDQLVAKDEVDQMLKEGRELIAKHKEFLSTQPSQKSDAALALSSLDSNWNRAEEWIKSAELFERLIVAPSINELKDAGAQIEDAHKRADEKARRAHLEQADEKIYNASHYAVDAAVAFVDREMQRYERNPGYTALNKHFGHYQELSGVLTRIRRRIDNSREERDQRNESYRDIAEGSDFKDLLRYFDELRGSVIAIRKSNNKLYSILLWVGSPGLVISVTLAPIAAPILPDVWMRLLNLLGLS